MTMPLINQIEFFTPWRVPKMKLEIKRIKFLQNFGKMIDSNLSLKTHIDLFVGELVSQLEL